MRLTTQSDYALRVLIYLAVQRKELSTIAEISDRYGIPKNHLMKVVQQLAREGFIVTVRGRAGGLKLAHPPAAINVGQVVRAMERDAVLVECFGARRDDCVIAPVCRLRGALSEAMEAFFHSLDGHALAELVDDNHLLSVVLAGGEV